MDPRSAFASSVFTLFAAFSQLAQYRITGNTAVVAIALANTTERSACELSGLKSVEMLTRVSPEEHATFSLLFHESTVVLAYSWLEAFLGEVEEALMLSDPSSLGESVQVKLGKILDMKSIEELIHDLARRRIRDRSQWGLSNRIEDLQKHFGIKISIKADDIRSLAELRNEIIHNRRPGVFELKGKRVSYKPRRDVKTLGQRESEQALGQIFQLMADLYEGSAKKLKLTAKFAAHKRNLGLIAILRRAWPQERTGRKTRTRVVH